MTRGSGGGGGGGERGAPRGGASASAGPGRGGRGEAAAFGGGRRDEERARARERIFSFRGPGGGWDPKLQRPELWDLYNARVHEGESVRVVALSDWREPGERG